ncbi:MAG: ThuA domain-containing protein [Planctomycetota bacterium]|nr:ThuA domain-containing protein [Planctomycetota bacterium]
MANSIRVLIWNEGRHEKIHPSVKKIYPRGMHAVIAEGLEKAGFQTRTATLDEPEHGLSEQALAETDVLTWWGHIAHGEVKDEIVARVQKRVLEGMGLIVLHSGHVSKIFRSLMGTTGALRWREAAERERLWTIEPSHPIAAGIGEYIELPNEEMYGERFDIPAPEQVVFISWFEGGEVFRSGCCWQRGHGRIFYFRPGHETYPTYYHPQIRQVIANACRWAAPRLFASHSCPNTPPLAKIEKRDIDMAHVPGDWQR